MIVLKANAESSSASPANLSTPNEHSGESSSGKSSLSFGELLRGAKVDTKDDAKSSTKGEIVLALEGKEVVLPMASTNDAKQTETKSSGLLTLLKGDAAILGEELESLELNPKVVENLSVKEIKTLINDAKSYLKEQIINSDGYKNSQNKELPQTLKGLAQLAKRFDIDISKITIEQVKVKPADVDADLDVKTKQTTKTVDVDDAPEVRVDKKTSKTAKSTAQTPDVDVDIPKDVKHNLKTDAKVSATPLFKAQTTPEVATTEQVVLAKQFVAQPPKTAKDRADETLKLLLRGEKPSHSNANVTADFSVATAKVIAPSATSDASRSLEALLRGDSSGQTADVKTEQMTTHKADSFEVKLNEAKQMVKYLSTDVKQAIEDYKSPFTRIKVQLNPQQLGEVDLTVVQRGKNLHVNISSNNLAVNVLAANLNELKTQLSNNGINNASFNFNSSSENGSSSNGQQNNRQQEQQDADEEYNYFDQEGQNEEILSSLEIVVPSYA